MKYVIDFGPVPTLPVAGSSGVFPVGRIYCAADLIITYAK